MRLCLVSDTHRYRHELLTAVKAAQPLDVILHAGDETADAAWLAERVSWPVHAVAGNWDTATPEFPLERILQGFGPILLLTHGHRLRVKTDLAGLAERAVACGARIIVFGHTHTAAVVVEDGRIYINPGSLSAPRGRRERTFAMLDISEHGEHYLVSVAHYSAAGRLISDSLVTVLVGKD